MRKEILVQTYEEGTRVAVVEDNRLAEIYFERNKSLVGNIYKGRVINILPGIQAAFVDIGLGRNTFLYVGDVISSHKEGHHGTENHLPIEKALSPGQEIIVQVSKDALNGKGARVTTQISLPGRFVVYMPSVDYVGVSRRIEDEKERERLRKAAAFAKPKGKGIIVRTVAEDISTNDLKEDIHYLENIWREISEKSKLVSAPYLLHREVSLVEKVLRDLFTDDVNQLYVNDRQLYDQIVNIVSDDETVFQNKVKLSDSNDLFEKHNITGQIVQALEYKVWLKSGGFLIIDHMEALTAIDVNTGKYIGRFNQEETVLKINLEAAIEIVRQLRLRNIGGIIIIDFIDMNKEKHKQKVLEVLEEELQKDKTRTRVLGITQLGLVEMTRKKSYPNLESTLLENCPYCDGKGKLLSEELFNTSSSSFSV